MSSSSMISSGGVLVGGVTGPGYDRQKAVKEFEESKIGVKGLVDGGLKHIPPFFVHPPQTLSSLKPTTNGVLGPTPAASAAPNIVPTIDLSEVVTDERKRKAAVEQVSRASRELGFFQVVNHGIPAEVLEGIIGGVKRFHEQPTEVKKKFYRREMGTGVSYFSNIDLFQSKAASWRDTLQVRFGPSFANLEDIPEVCRNELVEWDREAERVAEVLMELLSEGLGSYSGRLKDLTCLEARAMVGHYYPYCPQPDLTVGITSHTDPGVLTLLLQDHVGGLQIKHGEQWVDVHPVPGALVINIGDVLQIMSNDEYISVEHRVLANPLKEPRVSTAIFFNPGKRDNLFGPLTELISPEKPARFREFFFADYMRRFFTKELDGKTLTNFYRL